MYVESLEENLAVQPCMIRGGPDVDGKIGRHTTSFVCQQNPRGLLRPGNPIRPIIWEDR